MLLTVRVELVADADVTPILAMCDEEGKMLWSQIRSLDPNNS